MSEEAPDATAVAAKHALESMDLAEKSAARTAAAAKAIVFASRADAADSESDTSLGEVDEADAHQRYRDAVARADKDG
jgi:hypothetical protein